MSAYANVTGDEQDDDGDAITRAAFRHLVDSREISTTAARALGRAMGGQAHGEDLADAIDAFMAFGIGGLALLSIDERRYTFAGTDMRGAVHPDPPACAIALGYLEALVEAAERRPSVGMEAKCRVDGHPDCTFVVVASGAVSLGVTR